LRWTGPRFLRVLMAAVMAAIALASPSFAQPAADKAAKLIESAGQHHEKDEWKAAIGDATEALKLEPSSALAYTIRGDARTQIKDYKGAIADLTEAMRLDPTSRVIYINRGAAYRDSGQTDLALDDLDAAIRLSPDWEVGYRLKAELLIDAKRYGDAIPNLGKLIELQPERVYLLRDRAEAYAAMGDAEHAFADYDEAIRRSPNDSRFLRGRGLLHHSRGENDAALADLTAAVEAAPAAKDNWLARAKIYRAMGNASAAEADEQRAHNVPKNWPDAPEFFLLVALGLLLNPIGALPGIIGALIFRDWMKSLAAAVVLSLMVDFLLAENAFEDWGMLALAGMNALVAVVWWAIVRKLRPLWRGRRPTAPPPAPS
jgi:tetratricopeptide (TPR) repeat protein